jgi:hypothetical protein
MPLGGPEPDALRDDPPDCLCPSVVRIGNADDTLGVQNPRRLLALHPRRSTLRAHDNRTLLTRNMFDVDPAVWNEPTRRRAKELFGAPTRLILAAWILAQDDNAFFQQEVQDALRRFGEAPTAVRLELGTFVEQGLLNRFPDGRRVYFTQATSPIWAAYGALAVAFELAKDDSATPAPAQGRRRANRS